MQKTVSLSSTESEYIALSFCVQEIMFLKQFIEELNLELSLPIKVKVDNTGCMDIAKNRMSSKNSKHIDIHHHFIRDLIADGIIELEFVASDDNLADSFTKHIDQSRFLSHHDDMVCP